MAIADVALCVAIMGEIGIVPLVVSTSLTVNFMRKPSSTAEIVAVCKLMKLGKNLGVGEVTLYSEGLDKPWHGRGHVFHSAQKAWYRCRRRSLNPRSSHEHDHSPCERPGNENAIGEVTRQAFESHPYSHQTEHFIVAALRKAGALSLSGR